MKTLKIESGFTLIEIMIAVAIVAILAAVAYPAYLESLAKGRRAEGRTALLELLQQQERYITQSNRYFCFTNTVDDAKVAVKESVPGDGICQVNDTALTIPFKTFSGSSLESSSYVLSAQNCLGTDGVTRIPIQDCVQLVATPRGAHVKDTNAAGSLLINTTGTKACTGPKASVPGLCWP